LLKAGHRSGTSGSVTWQRSAGDRSGRFNVRPGMMMGADGLNPLDEPGIADRLPGAAA
jgi:hypothetical protein